MSRVVSEQTIALLGYLVGALFVAGGAGLALAAGVARHPSLAAITAACVVGIGITEILLARSLPRWAVTKFEVLVWASILSAGAVASLGQFAIGPRIEMAALVDVEAPIFAFYLLPVSAAVFLSGIAVVEFGSVLLFQPGYPAAAIQCVFLVATVVLIGAVVGGLLKRSEWEATRMSRLRRFLAPQVADVVLNSNKSVTAPHRAEICVVFLDLRGFTHFVASSEPEDVGQLLDRYYSVVGSLIQESGATIGGYAGDGIMAYFNDPLPHPDPTGAALNLAIAAREALAVDLSTWRHLGHDLGIGIGIACGYATVGVVGFEGRFDYTALGTVVNLAARLCASAADSEILLDDRTRGRLAEVRNFEPRQLTLKGFSTPIRAHSLVVT